MKIENLPKENFTWMILLILLGSSISLHGQGRKQDRKQDRCKMTLDIPEDFLQVEIDDSFLTFVVKRANASIAITKEICDYDYNLFSARSVAMAYYHDLLMEDGTSDVQVQTLDYGGNNFIVLNWNRFYPNSDMTYHMIAFNDACNILYRIQLYADSSKEEKVTEQFLDLLASCQTIGWIHKQ